MKKIISAILILTLCLSLWACSGGVAPDQQNTEPKVTIDPNAEPEIVLDEASTKQDPLSDTSNQVVGYLRYTEGTNCGVVGTVRIEYLDATENVVQTFSPQLPGGTLTWRASTWNGTFSKEVEYVVEKNGHTTVTWTIEPNTNGRPLLCDYLEGTGKDRCCTRIDVYNSDGQVATRVKVSKEGNSLHFDPSFKPENTDWSNIVETFTIWETDSNPISYTVRQCLLDGSKNLVLEIISDPVIGPYDPLMMADSRKIEIRDHVGKTQTVYEASGEDTRIGARYIYNTGMLYVEEESLNHDLLLREERIPGTATVAYREVKTYDEAGNCLSTEYVFWNGKVLTTPSDQEDLFTKVEFYNANGELAKTVELIENSAYIHLGFGTYWLNGNETCEITFFSKTGEKIGRDSFVSQSSLYYDFSLYYN